MVAEASHAGGTPWPVAHGSPKRDPISASLPGMRTTDDTTAERKETGADRKHGAAARFASLPSP